MTGTGLTHDHAAWTRDMVGGDYVPRELSALRDDGRLSIIALLGGARAQIDLNQIFGKIILDLA